MTNSSAPTLASPCIPLQLFRRGIGIDRQARVPQLCGRLAADLDALSCGGASLFGLWGGGSPQVAISEGIQQQLRTALDIFSEAADKVESVSCQGDDPRTAEVAGDFLRCFLGADLPARLVASLPLLEFDARMQVLNVLSAVLRLGPVLRADVLIGEYAATRPHFFRLLVDGYASPEVFTHCGVMLRSCARHRQLIEAFFANPDVALQLLSLTHHDSFDVSSDAFSSLRDVLLTHKDVAAKFLSAHFRDFFANYNRLLLTDEYVTQRQSLKLLVELLQDEAFLEVMLAYIEDEQFLQIHMNLLRADSRFIQFEAFQVFKLFVANKRRPPRVQLILYRNKERLVRLLGALQPPQRIEANGQPFADRDLVVHMLQTFSPPCRISKGSSTPRQ